MPGRNKGDTTIEIPIPIRDRVRVVAALERIPMKKWIEKRVVEAEEKFGIRQEQKV